MRVELATRVERGGCVCTGANAKKGEVGGAYAFVGVPVAAVVVALTLPALEEVLVEYAAATVLHARHQMLHYSICEAEQQLGI
jgi:hypothetical protein